jgi:hypothetical protein
MSQSVDLAVPSFSAHSVLDLGPALRDLGLQEAFSPAVGPPSPRLGIDPPPQADFSGLNGAKDLRLGSFLQINTFAMEAEQVWLVGAVSA